MPRLKDVLTRRPKLLLVGINPGLRSGALGIALTNLCGRPTRAAAELKRADIERGRRTLARKCTALRPRVVAFVGLSVYQMYFRRPRSGGPGPKLETLGGAPIFVVPNPSGLNASFPGFEHKLVWFRALREFVERLE